MTIQEAMDLANQMKPNMMIPGTQIRFLSELEGKIHEEIVMKHVHTEEEETKPQYDTGSDPGTVLLVPAPYDMLYVYWLMSKIDLMNMEMDKYNNDRALFENAYDEMSDWWTRTKMPLQAAREFML